MKVSTSLVVAAALVALSTSAKARTLAGSSDYDSEHLLSTTMSSDTMTESSAETPLESLDEAFSEELTTGSSSDTNSDSLAYTEGSTIEPYAETSLTSLDEYGLTSGSSDLTDEALGYTTDSSAEATPTDSSADTSTTESYDETSSLESTTEESTTEETTSDGSFTNEQKSIWIERHNYFRVAGLPWSAGNMQRIGWNDDLVKEAAQAASSCAASTSTGLNVYQSTSTDPSTVIEEAINAWVIEPSLSNIGSVVPPAAEGDAVGAGLYNSYTQVVWASTTSVGCAMASCSGGSMVVCEYSPAGNDGKSAWYVHFAQAKQCPTGTDAVHGLCVVEGDSANDLIAPIPNGKWSFQVYPSFVADIMATILEAAKARDAPGADPATVIFPSGSAYESSPTDTEQTTSLHETETSLGSADTPSVETSLSSLGEGYDVASSVDDTYSPSDTSEMTDDYSDLTTGSYTEATGSSSLHEEGLDMTDVSESLLSTPTESSGEMSELSTLDDSYSPTSDSSTSTEDSLTPDLLATNPTDLSSEFAELSSTPTEEVLGEVKPSSATGSYFENAETSPSLESVTTSSSSEPSTDLSEESPDSDSKTAVIANNKSSAARSDGTVVSAAGIAGIIVLGVVAVAALAVYVSYRKNQQRQHDIMRDGGIEVI